MSSSDVEGARSLEDRVSALEAQLARAQQRVR